MKSKLKIFLKIGLYVFSAMVIFFFGMYSYKNESIRNTIFSIKKLKNVSYSNYNLGAEATTPKLELIIPDSSKSILNSCRENAIKANILRDEDKIIVPGKIVHLSDTLKIEMRLKGDYSDHWAGDKWSYRIKVKGGQELFGMKSFSIQAPETRGHLNEWYFHNFLKEEGLIALRYGFVSLTENSVEKGVYAIEESFDKNVIEFNERREAPILKFDESILIDHQIINSSSTYSQEDIYLMAKIDVFKSKRTLKNDLLYDQFQKGKFLLKKLRAREIELGEAVDIDKAARLFAIADITGGHHGLRWKNIRFYFNPIIGKLELIGFDSNSGHLISDIYYNLWDHHNLNEYEVYRWKSIFFEDDDFLDAYFHYLAKYSAPGYLKRFHNKIESEMNLYLTYMYKENSMYRFYLEHYEMNANLILNKLNEYNESRNPKRSEYFVEVKAADSISYGDLKINIKVKNKSFETATILGVFNPDEKKISANSNYLIKGSKRKKPAEDIHFNFDLLLPIDSSQIKLKRNKNRWVHKKIKLGYQFSGQLDTFYTKIEHYYPSNSKLASKTEEYSNCFEIDHSSQTVLIREGQWSFNRSIVTPKGYKLICKKGTTITLNNNATLVVNGPVNFSGTSEDPIIITSEDSTGSFFVYQTQFTSELNYVRFSSLSESDLGKWRLSGGINFYESDVNLNHVSFNYSKSEDALNIVRSSFTMKNCSFNHIQSDAFDADFCKGEIISTTFDNVGNDAIDVSGSQISLDNINISEVSDKGISAGEKSYIVGSNISIQNGELGIVSKDFSFVNLKMVRLENLAIGFTAYRKKDVFGPAQIELSECKVEDLLNSYLLETGSIGILNGKKIQPNHSNVSDILYGNLFGKSSK